MIAWVLLAILYVLGVVHTWAAFKDMDTPLPLLSFFWPLLVPPE